jgi:hydroxypyruvate reductase
VRHHVLASNRTALAAAREAAAARGWRAVRVTDALRGEARIAGRRLGGLGRAARLGCAHAGRPLCLLAGGETVVTVRGSGRGGRCQELALAAALELEGCDGVALLAAGTDGTDGPTDAAGAFADAGTGSRGRARGVDARAALARNDAYGFFAAEGGLLRTGPTGTNVMDLVLLAVAPGAAGATA